MKKMMVCKQFLVLGLSLLAQAGFADEGFVAGLKPYERPEGAAKITAYQPGAARQAMAIKGVAEPRTGIGFLKDQGAWYTPFDRPNLTGRYDIRGMHAADNNKKD